MGATFSTMDAVVVIKPPAGKRFEGPPKKNDKLCKIQNDGPRYQNSGARTWIPIFQMVSQEAVQVFQAMV
jgi:hypothetical protein